MTLRVIGGTAKGRRLKLVPGDSTRPIMDRVKEALFNIIGRGIYDAHFLDLFAGTGSVGIEALSRGAAHALFNDFDRAAYRTILDNLTITGLADRADVRRSDAFALLRQPPDRLYDLIYIAPPQYKEVWLQTIRLLDGRPAWYHKDTQVIVQIDPIEYQPLALARLSLIDQRRYGNTLLCFFRPQSPDLSPSTAVPRDEQGDASP